MAADSVPLELPATKYTSTASSLSWMVYVWFMVAPRVASDGLDRVTCTVSSASSRESSVTAREMEPEVVPGERLRVPESRV